MNQDFMPYYKRKDELATMDGVLTWGLRLVIPPTARPRILQILHDTHLGISRVKALARSYVWWSQIDSDFETEVRSCMKCQLNQNVPATAELHSWEWPTKPWSRLHNDHAGPFMGFYFFLVVDSHSK